MIDPRIEFKPSKRNALNADADLGERGPHSALKRLRSMSENSAAPSRSGIGRAGAGGA